jgi:hypothetical protein
MPLTGYLETADIAETSRNSGLTKVTRLANCAPTDGTQSLGCNARPHGRSDFAFALRLTQLLTT